MNSYKQSSSGTGQNAVKPFCKVCYDAGKPEREYTSHFVKSKPGNDGKVVCPYLLSLKCTYCKKNEGHTASHCPLLAAKKTQEKVQEKKPVVDQDGWEVKKGGKAQAQPKAQAQEPKAQTQTQVQKAQTQTPQQKKSTLSVLAEMMVKEEKKEMEVEVKRVEYETHFPGGSVPCVLAAKPSWGSGKPNWSVIAKQAPGPATFVPHKPQPQVQQQKKEEEDDGISDISDDEEERNSDRAWGWSGDWNDCPN